MEYCLDCGIKLRGRMDKKFCDDHCRSNYNNALNRQRNSALNEINQILKRNAHTLEKLSQRGIIRLTRKMLAASGFNFSFFTHQVYGIHGECYYCCYNYGYRALNEDEIILFSAVELPPVSNQCKI